MIITCGQCQAKFKVAPEQIKETGSKVRCSNCQYVFTVYRPKRAAETPASPSAATSNHFADGAGRGDYYPAGGASRASDDFYGDHHDDGDRPRYDGGEYSGDGYADDDGRLANDSLSMRERRDRRRQFYSDREDSPGEPDYDDDPLGDAYDDDYSPDGLPSLRRNRATRLSSSQPERNDAPYEDDFDPEDIRDASPAQDDLGLGVDPADDGSTESGGYQPDAFARLAAGYESGSGVKNAMGKMGGRYRLLAVLALVAAVLAVGIYFLTRGPDQASLVSGYEAPGAPEAGGNNQTAAESADQSGTAHITFPDGQQRNFYRTNNHSGEIIVLTGMVTNSYPEPRSFIKLRGHLLTADEKTLADRFVFAGNMLSEEELKELPMTEIANRLMIKGGQNNMNVAIPPGSSIPFMVVFDNLPAGAQQYRIDAVGSDPAD